MRLEAKIAPIASRPVDLSDPKWVEKGRTGPRPLDEAGVREEGESLLMEFVAFYSTVGEVDRRHVRKLFEQFHAFAWATAVPLGPETKTGFIAHLLHFSILDQGRDPRDARRELQSLLVRATEAGIDVRSILNDVAALSSDENRYSWGSTREWLMQACKEA